MIRSIVARSIAACLVLLAVAAPGRSQTAPPPGRLDVVATFSILADFIGEVGGERVQVTSLVGPDRDAHNFEPSPADAARIAGARLVVANGLGFEGWIGRLLKASGSKAEIVTASRGVKTIAPPADHHHHGGAKIDPHAFQNVVNARLYVANIRDALSLADPDGKAVYERNAARYAAELDRLEAEVRAEIARIPAARRRVITSHDAFGYFAAAYGFTFIAPRGVSTESEISARDIARIVRQIKAEKIPAVFLENVADERLMDRIAKESGARIGGKLYSDALSGPDGSASSYVRMMRHNARTLAAALID